MTDFDVKMNRIESEDCRLKIMNEKWTMAAADNDTHRDKGRIDTEIYTWIKTWIEKKCARQK